jgi:hypothetical protein
MKKTTIILVMNIFISILLASFSAAETAPKLTLTDVKGHWAESTIYSMVELGIVNGFPNETFRPEDKVTRAQFIKMVMEAAALPMDQQAAGEQWYEIYVRAAINEGIHREADFKDQWNQNLTRREMARLAVRATDETTLPANAIVNDRSFMVKATSTGLINGMADGSLNPEGLSTRAQAVTVIERILDLKEGNTLPTDQRAIDNAKRALEYGEGHLAIQTGKLYDIDDLSIVDAFYEKYKDSDIGLYKNAEQLKEHIKGAREIVAQIKVEKDLENQQFVITMPEHDPKKYNFSLTTINEQYSEAGTYTVQFKDSAKNGAIYKISISDYRVEAFILYLHFGYTINGEYFTGEGSLTKELIDGASD